MFAAAFLCLAGGLRAQAAEPPQAVSGVVTDDKRNPLSGAELTLERDSSSAAARSLTRSAADGSFVFDGVPSGPLYMKVRRLGFRPFATKLRADTMAQGAELDDVTRPSDIDGIEIYSSWAGVPPQFADRGGRNCGAILVWTRIR